VAPLIASEAFHWQTGPVCIRVPEDQTRAVVPGATLDDDLGRPAVQVVQQKGAWLFPGQYWNGDSLSARTPAWASVRIKRHPATTMPTPLCGMAYTGWLDLNCGKPWIWAT
jgi:hypothetical protein